MANIFIRDIDDDDLKAIDALAATRGLLRNELLRHELRALARRSNERHTSVDDLRQSLALSVDLLNDKVMRGSWQ